MTSRGPGIGRWRHLVDLILMTVLLALLLAAIVRNPPCIPGHAEQESASQSGLPESAAGRLLVACRARPAGSFLRTVR